MTPNQRLGIERALGVWSETRAIHKNMHSCPDPDLFIQSTMKAMAALDGVRTSIIDTLPRERRAEAERGLADTVALSYIRTLEHCEQLASRFQ